MLRRGFITFLLLVAIGAPVVVRAGATPLRVREAASTVPRFNHVFLIFGENTSFQDVTLRHTPYLVETLMRKGGALTNYFGLADGSLANYVAMAAGHFKPCEVNDDLPYNPNTNKLICTEPGPSLFSQLDSAGITWAEWSESMPNACGFIDSGEDWTYNVYSTHHNAAVYFDSVEGARYQEAYGQPPNVECLQRDLPMGSTGPNDTTAFGQALAAGSVPQFNLIIPNDCEQGHDFCGGVSRYRQFDDFLAREVPLILASPAFGSDGLLLVTYDEWGDNTPHDRHIAFVAYGPLVRPHSSNGAHYDHYSLLRTLEDGYGLRPYLGNANTATSFAGIWASGR